MLDLFSSKFRSPAECIVKVDGSPITDLYPFLTEVKVEAGRSDASVATLSFETRRDGHGLWTVQDAEVLVPWARVEIRAKLGTKDEDVFHGFVAQLDAQYPEDAADAKVVVECRDASLALDREHVRRVWGKDAPMSEQTIVETIAARNRLKLDKPIGEGQTVEGLNQDTTDWKFLQERAAVNGYELHVEGADKLYFGPMRLGGDPQDRILVYAGPDTSCQSISVRADGHKPEKVGYDAVSKEGAKIPRQVLSANAKVLGKKKAAQGGKGLREFVWLLSREGISDEKQLAALAKAKANEMAMRVVAEGELDGARYGHVLRVGRTVGVDGVGGWLGGTYYVDHVTHLFSMDGYKQSFRLLRNAYGDNLPGGSSGLLGGL